MAAKVHKAGKHWEVTLNGCVVGRWSHKKSADDDAQSYKPLTAPCPMCGKEVTIHYQAYYGTPATREQPEEPAHFFTYPTDHIDPRAGTTCTADGDAWDSIVEGHLVKMEEGPC